MVEKVVWEGEVGELDVSTRREVKECIDPEGEVGEGVGAGVDRVGWDRMGRRGLRRVCLCLCAYVCLSVCVCVAQFFLRSEPLGLREIGVELVNFSLCFSF